MRAVARGVGRPLGDRGVARDAGLAPSLSELHEWGHMTTGPRLSCKEFLRFSTMPCRQIPLLVHFCILHFLFNVIIALWVSTLCPVVIRPFSCTPVSLIFIILLIHYIYYIYNIILHIIYIYIFIYYVLFLFPSNDLRRLSRRLSRRRCFSACRIGYYII